MQFLYPSFLWALTALAIPVIIHLFHFRRFKKVYFTNVHLLKELKQETSNRNKLKSLLILLSRCLALAAIVFAFAQPIIKKTLPTGNAQKLVMLFVDNSFSMNATKDEVPLLTLAKDRAIDIAKAYSEGDKYVVITHDLESKHLRLVNQKTAIAFLEEIKATPKVIELQQASAIVNRLSAGHEDMDVMYYVLSDFQETISQFETPLDSSIQVTVVPMRTVQENNLSINSARFEAPVAMLNQNNQLLVNIQNHGENDEDIEFRMKYQGQERPLGTLKIGSSTTVIDTVSLAIDRVGWHDVELMIDDYPIEFDDHLFLSFEIKSKLSVLAINEGATNRYINTAIGSLESFELDQMTKNALRFNEWGKYNLIILDELADLSSGLETELVKYVNSGGNLLVFPAKNTKSAAYNNLLSALNADLLGERIDAEKQVYVINQDDFIFDDVFESVKRNLRLPSTTSSFALNQRPSISREVLLRNRDNTVYLSKYIRGKGQLYLCTAPLQPNSNDLVLNAEIFVPMLYKMAISSGLVAPLSYTIGEDNLITMKDIETADAGAYRMTSENGEFIPGILRSSNENYIDIAEQISLAGQYQLKFNDQLKAQMAFNYDRKESNVKYSDLNMIAQSIGLKTTKMDDVALADLSAYISQQVEGVRLWRWCIIIALLFLLIETLLIRFWK